MGRVIEVLLAFLRLGAMSFGGPVAHLGYLREEFVARRHWLDEREFADLVGLGQLLPGPASSQVAIAIGAHRAGPLGGLAAWVGFCAVSVLIMLAVARAMVSWQDALPAGLLHGLQLVAVAVVANAVWSMSERLCPDALRAGFAVATAVVVLLVPAPITAPLVLVVAAVAGSLLLPETRSAPSPSQGAIGAGWAWAAIVAFLVLLSGCVPWLLSALGVAPPGGAAAESLGVFDRFFRSGALVFGGGHVVLPLLDSAVVEPGWADPDLFLAGYGVAQAVPGPLFTFAAYLGSVLEVGPGGVRGGLLALVAIYLPSFLLLAGALPAWRALGSRPRARRAMLGVNAAVVGLLLAALYDPVFSRSVLGGPDLAMALSAFGLLRFARCPPWLLVLLGAALGVAVEAMR